MTPRTTLLLALLAAPSRASECPAKKCANWCKSELKENHCRVQPGEEEAEEEEEEESPAASPVSPEATNFRAPISNFLEKTSREVEKKGVPRWDEGARKPRGNHAELD